MADWIILELTVSLSVLTLIPHSCAVRRYSPKVDNLCPRILLLGGIQTKSYGPCSQLSSVQFSHSVVSDSLWPHGLQHAKLPCPSPAPKPCSNLCPSSQWCHPTISSSVISFFPCLQSFPASGSFPMRQFFASGGQSIGSFSFTISPSNGKQIKDVSLHINKFSKKF